MGEGAVLPIPATIICADWSSRAAGRAVCVATTRGPAVSLKSPPKGGWTVERVVHIGREARQPDEALVVGFDAPIGLPRSYWELALKEIPRDNRPATFAEWLARDDFDAGLFEPCEGAEAWCIERPFLRVQSGKGGRTSYEAAMKQAGVEGLRHIDQVFGGKSVFMVGGIPGVAGGSACHLWRGLRPMRRAGAVSIWPFDGSLDTLALGAAPMIAEIYPRLSYAVVLDGETASRNSTAGRRKAVEALRRAEWVSRHRVQIEGLTEAEASEDAFDAIFSAGALLRLALERRELADDAIVDDTAEGAMLMTAARRPTQRSRSRTRPDRKVSRRAAGIYRVRITLRELAPPIWREIRIAGSDGLSRLHDAIQVAFDWTNTHLHEFAIAGCRYGVPDDEDPGATVDDTKVRIADVLREGDRAVYVYDFGDDWIHDIVVESVDQADPAVTYPICTGGARACPPDDAGGPHGYQSLLEALLDPAHEEHANVRRWVGGYWDPDGFDPNAINRRLREVG